MGQTLKTSEGLGKMPFCMMFLQSCTDERSVTLFCIKTCLAKRKIVNSWLGLEIFKEFFLETCTTEEKKKNTKNNSSKIYCMAISSYGSIACCCVRNET